MLGLAVRNPDAEPRSIAPRAESIGSRLQNADSAQKYCADPTLVAPEPEMRASAGTNGRSSPPAQNSRLDVLIATYRRPELLRRLLVSLRGEARQLAEVVVASPDRLNGIEELIKAERAHLPGLRLFLAPSAAKAGSLNAMASDTHSPNLAFLDDDVEVQRGWAAGFLEQMEGKTAAAFQGRIQLPPCPANQQDARELARCFGTHPMVDMGSEPCSRRKLTGANFALRRSMFERLGGFDSRLGPGASGLCEDTDLGLRLRARDENILYVPKASVVHAWFPERATQSYQREYFTRLGRSRWIMKGGPAWPRVLPDLLYAHAAEFVAKLAGREPLLIHRRGRLFHYQAMLACALRRDPVLTEFSGLSSGVRAASGK